MRLDLFLKATRLVMRRTLAQEMCDAGLVTVNGTPAKSARSIKVGDEISLRRRTRVLSVRVDALPTGRQTSRSDASTLFQILSDSEEPRELLG